MNWRPFFVSLFIHFAIEVLVLLLKKIIKKAAKKMSDAEGDDHQHRSEIQESENETRIIYIEHGI